MKNILFYLLSFLSIATINCKKENAADNPGEKSTFSVTKLLPLPDNIPYDSLGSGKIVFERSYAQGRSCFYVIDINNRKTSGFQIDNCQMTQPNISPDGNKIACSLVKSGDATATWNIYIMNTDGSGCFPAFASDNQACFPAWSPDGSKLVFYTRGDGGRLYRQSAVENATDREELVSFSDDSDPHWLIKPIGGFTLSPDGKLVAVSTSENLDGLIDVTPFSGKEGVHRIVSPYTDLGFESPDFSILSPVFSPDGSRIAFLSIYTPAGSNYLSFSYESVNPNGSDRIPLGGMGGYKPDVDHTPYASICWSPDASKILVAIPDGEKTSHLWVIRPNGTGPVPVTNQLNVFDSNVSWSE